MFTLSFTSSRGPDIALASELLSIVAMLSALSHTRIACPS
jgi:hypothetical protein